MKKTYTICTIAGDSIGPELLKQALLVLEAAGLSYRQVKAEAGFDCFKKHGTPLPPETIEAIKAADATLFIAVTTPPHIKNYRSPIVALRQKFNLYANVRPIKSLPLKHQSQDIDFVIVRENTEGLYSGKEKDFGHKAIAQRIITREACERIARFAFELAKSQNRRKVTAIHKANILRLTDGLFLKSVEKIASNYPDIELEDMLVDSAAMRLIKQPQHFDVIVTTNMFGDILSDEAAMLVGGLGVVASGNIGDTTAIFEPVHGSAPKYQGQDKVNPLATLFSVVMMLEFLEETELAANINRAIIKTINQGITTNDLGGTAPTSQVIKSVIKFISQETNLFIKN